LRLLSVRRFATVGFEMKDKHLILFHTLRIPRYLFHISTASACVVLIITLIMLVPVLVDIVKEWLK